MNNTPPPGAQAPAYFDPTNPVTSAAGPASADLSNLDKLRECVNRGLCVIPEHGVIFDHPDAGMVRCACGDPECTGKHPSILWKGVTAPLTFDEVEYWYSRSKPLPVMGNWAILLGACDPQLVVLDIDTRNGGLESFAALTAKHGPLPHTWRDESSQRGGHFYFVAPPGLPEKAKVEIGPGLDFLVGRHLVVIDPSTHWSGVKYRWLVPPWGATPVAPLPVFLRDLAISSSTAKQKKTGGAFAPAPRPTGNRSRPAGTPPTDTITADDAEVVRQALACVPEWPLSIQGQGGSKACFAAACRITLDFGLRGAAAWAVMIEYNRQRCLPAWSDAELEHKLNDAAKGPVTGKLLDVDWVAIREELSGIDPAAVAHLLTDTLDDQPPSPPSDSGTEPPDDDGPDDDGPDDGGAPVPPPPAPPTPPPTPTAPPSAPTAPPPVSPLPPPAPAHPLASAAAAARVIRKVTHPDPAVVAKADAWSAAHAAGPGVYLDRDPPADAAAVVGETLTRTRVVRSLTVLQAGKDCEDAAHDITVGGPRAAAYPIRTSETCKNLKEVHRAEALGLAPTAAVCPECPHNTAFFRENGFTDDEYANAIADLPRLMAGDPHDDPAALPWHVPPAPSSVTDCPTPAPRRVGVGDLVPQCPHLVALDAVKHAPHRVATTARAALNFDATTADAEVVFLIDNAEDVLTPHAVTDAVRAHHLDLLARAVTWAERKCRRAGKPAEWWEALRATTDAIQATLAGGTRATIPPAPAVLAPQLWPAALWSAWGATHAAEWELPDQLVRVCTAFASGELRSLVFTPDTAAGSDPIGWLSATWFPRVPADATVIALADAPAGVLSGAIKRPVTDITSGGPPGWAARAVQCPTRVTGGSRESGVAARIRGHLASYPGERFAVLLPGNRKHFGALRGAVEDLLVPAERDRIAFAGWYDKGVPACDRVLALGAPVVPGRSVERRLEQRDLIPAVVAGGDWGDVTWTGVWADGMTRPAVVGRGFRHPDWATAYRDATLDLLRRKLAGVAVPISVLSDADLGGLLPLAEEPRPVDRDELILLEALRDEIAAGQPADAPLTLRSERRIQKSKKGVRAKLSVSTPRLAEHTGKPESTVRRLMGDLADAGFAGRVGKRGGWTWPGPVVYPDYGTGEGTDATEAKDSTDTGGTSTPAASGESAPLDRPVPELAVAVSDPVPADAPASEQATGPVTSPVTEPAEPKATAESGTAAEARWDTELQSLIGWFFVVEDTLPHTPFRLPRPGRPGGFVVADDPPALYARLWGEIVSGPRAQKANGLAQNLRELYSVFGPQTETQPADGPPTGAAA